MNQTELEKLDAVRKAMGMPTSAEIKIHEEEVRLENERWNKETQMRDGYRKDFAKWFAPEIKQWWDATCQVLQNSNRSLSEIPAEIDERSGLIFRVFSLHDKHPIKLGGRMKNPQNHGQLEILLKPDGCIEVEVWHLRRKDGRQCFRGKVTDETDIALIKNAFLSLISNE